MPKYKCMNVGCPLYDEVMYQNAKIRMVDGNTKDLSLECPKCGKEREEIKDKFEGFTTTMHGSPNISRR